MSFCIVYARVSTDEQARSGYSLTEQLRACRQRAEQVARGMPILEFTDDMSGEILERPGLQAALDLVEQGQVSHFICLDPDRLARRLMLQLIITERIEKHGCQLEFVQHDYQDTPEGRLFYQMRGAIAEYEKLKILERTARGARGKIEMGGLPHVIRLYGYRFVKGAGKVAARYALVPDENEARIVYTMMRWCAEEGIGPLVIANRLNELGIPTKTGKKWSHTQVRRILRNEVYATGRLALRKKDHHGIAVARQLPPEERKRRGIVLSARKRPVEEWKYVQVDPIVPMELWQKVLETLDGFRVGERANNDPTRVKMLTSLGKCGICGSTLHYLCGRKIVCSGRYRKYFKPAAESTDCNLPAKPAAAVEEAVWEEVKSWILNPARWAEAVRVAEERLNAGQAGHLIDTAGLVEEIAALEQQLADKKEEQHRIGVLFSRKLWPEETALAELDRIAKEIQALETRLAELRKQQGEPARQHAERPPILLHDEAWRQRAAEMADKLDYNRKLELVRQAVESFVLYPTGRGEKPKVVVYPRI